MQIKYLLPLLTVATFSHAELIGLDESSLEGISGQAGLTVELHKQIEIGEILYSDKENTQGEVLDFKDVVIGHPSDVMNQQAISVHTLDVDGTEGLVIFSQFEATRFQIGSISVGDHRGNSADNFITRQSFGSVQYDWMGNNTLKINGKSAGESGLIISSETHITNSDFRWSTNNNTFVINDMIYNSVGEFSVDVEDVVAKSKAALVIRIPNFSYDYSMASMCFANTDCTNANSLGSFSGNRSYINSDVYIYGGGREGVGITIDSQFTFDITDNATTDGNFVTYTDDASIKFAKLSGTINTTGFTFDIGRAETNLGDHIALQWDQVSGNIKSDLVEIAGNKVGAIEVVFDFSDGVHEAVTYQNKTLLAPGVAFAQYDFNADTKLAAAGFDSYMTDFYSKVNATSDGISLFNEWNLIADILYTDNGNTLIVDNYQTYGSGYTTLDIRSGDLSLENTNDVNESFLAIGVKDYKVNYQIDGLKVGNDTSELQGGYELLGLSPEASFTMNAAIEIRGGGAVGSGVTFDGDVLLSDGNFALTKSILNYNDGNALNDKTIGVYLDGVNYEYHFRNLTLDVDADGIKLALGELWSDFTVEDVRFGDKKAGNSLGGLEIKQYQKGSELVISGGSTDQCIGAVAGNAADCTTASGTWVDGSEGLTLKSKQLLQKRLLVTDSKENSIAWIANRTVNDNGTPGDTSDDFYNVNSGQRLKLDNIYTTDGLNDVDNTFGIQSTTQLDVADSTTGLVISNNLQIKELNVESLQLIHPTGGTDTLLHGMRLQNLNLSSTLNVAPIP